MALRSQGKKVACFKLGPDFLDPMLLQASSDLTVYQLDLWMMGEKLCRELLYRQAEHADFLLIESSMGLFDGTPSTADFAKLFDIPILLLVNARGMGQSFAALAHGLYTFDTKLKFFGILANHVAGPRHESLLRERLGPHMAYLGSIGSQHQQLPSRHLGLLQAQEIPKLPELLHQLGAHVSQQMQWTYWPPATCCLCKPTVPALERSLEGQRIAVARDDAFSFIYPHNLEILESMGAILSFFSPVRDHALPECDSIYLPGGYPELHLPALRANHSMRDALRQHFTLNKPILAECGGMIYCAEHIQTGDRTDELLGLLPGRVVIHTQRQGLGMHSLRLAQQEIRAHSFHYAALTTAQPPAFHSQALNPFAKGEAIYQNKGLTASFLHFYFGSNPHLIAQWLTRVKNPL